MIQMINKNVLTIFPNNNIQFGLDGYYERFFTIAGNAMGYICLKGDTSNIYKHNLDFNFTDILYDIDGVENKLKSLGLKLHTNSQKLGDYQPIMRQFIYKTMYAILLIPGFTNTDLYKQIIDNVYNLVQQKFLSGNVNEIKEILPSIRANSKSAISQALAKFGYNHENMVSFAILKKSKKSQSKSSVAVPLEHILNNKELINEIDLDELVLKTAKGITALVNKKYITKQGLKINRNTADLVYDSNDLMIKCVDFPSMKESYMSIIDMYQVSQERQKCINEYIDYSNCVWVFFDIEPKEDGMFTPIK